jgi:hypothetical protein
MLDVGHKHSHRQGYRVEGSLVLAAFMGISAALLSFSDVDACKSAPLGLDRVLLIRLDPVDGLVRDEYRQLELALF